MSIVSPAARILVTGASGFIGVQVSKTLVENGFRVLGTVRNAEKGEYLAKLLPNRFESIIVPDTHKVGRIVPLCRTYRHSLTYI